MKIDEGDIIEDQNNENIEIHIKGKIMQKSSSTISLKSIYDLVVNIQKDFNNFKDSTNKKFDILEKDNKEIKQRLTIIEKDIKKIKSLPTIQKELNLI